MLTSTKVITERGLKSEKWYGEGGRRRRVKEWKRSQIRNERI